jgi:DNA-binding NtrC family response regulator
MARILLVDDDQDVLDTVADWLRLEHEVKVALGFPEALAALAAGPTPDAVITDYHMPPYFGDDLLGIVAERYPDTCRILHTGAQNGPIACFTAHHVLIKGGDLVELSALIRRCVPWRRTAEGAALAGRGPKTRTV